jgi:NAD(P)H-hydrate repair Nnr-like enzyme with NAD(P)H-hydrate dehydratase domain
LRTGAGLVSAAVAPESLTVVSAGRPEIMARAVTGAIVGTGVTGRAVSRASTAKGNLL